MNKVQPKVITTKEEIKKEDLKYITPKSNKKQITRLKKSALQKLENGVEIPNLKEAKFLSMHLRSIAPFSALTDLAKLLAIDSKKAERYNLRALFELYSVSLKYQGQCPKYIEKACKTQNIMMRYSDERSQFQEVSSKIHSNIQNSFAHAEKLIFGGEKNWFDEISKITDFFKENPESYDEVLYPKKFDKFSGNVNILAAKWFYGEFFLNWQIEKNSEETLKKLFQSLKKLMEDNPDLAGLKGPCVTIGVKILKFFADKQETQLKWPEKMKFKKVSEIEEKYGNLHSDDMSKKNYHPRELSIIAQYGPLKIINGLGKKIETGEVDEILLLNVLTGTGGKYRCLLEAINDRRESKLTIDALFHMRDKAQNISNGAIDFKELKKNLKGVKGEEKRKLFLKSFKEQQFKLHIQKTALAIECMILNSYGGEEKHHEDRKSVV